MPACQTRGSFACVWIRPKLSLRKKLQTTLVALIGVVLGLSAVTLWATLQWQRSEQEKREHYLRSLLLQEVRAGTFRAFKEVPDAVFSGDAGAQREFASLLGEAETDFRSWVELAHTELEKQQVQEVRASYDVLIRHAHQVFELMAAGQRAEATRILEDQIEREDFDRFEMLSARAEKSDQEYRQLIRRKSERTREIAQLALGTAAAATIGLVALLGLYFIRGMFRPLREVEKALSALGRGDLQPIAEPTVLRPASVRAEDELSTLVHAFNRTVDELGRTTVSKAYLDNIIESMVDALVVTSPDGTIRTANPAAGVLFETPRDRLIGRKVDEFIPLQNLAKGERLRDQETTVRTSGGREIPVSLSRSVMRGEDGGSLGTALVAQDITERKRAEDQIRAALEEKEVLFKEINHRVKNNLQVVSSLLNLHARQLADPEANQILRESRNRIEAMALVHEMLYRSETPARINLGDYLQSLTRHLMDSYGTGASAVRLELRINPLPMSLNLAIPCGLIINELVTNSLKHAFPDGMAGAIVIELREVPGRHCTLNVSDTGIGLPPHIRIEDTPTLGLRLVRTLVEQLGGNLSVGSQGGARFEILFPFHQEV